MSNISENDDEDVMRAKRYFNSHNKDDLKIVCGHCGSEDMTGRAEASYHNHEPLGLCLDEIWECDDCGRYTLAIYRLAEVRKLDSGKWGKNDRAYVS